MHIRKSNRARARAIIAWSKRFDVQVLHTCIRAVAPCSMPTNQRIYGDMNQRIYGEIAYTVVVWKSGVTFISVSVSARLNKGK